MEKRTNSSLEALKRLRNFNKCDIQDPRVEEELTVIEKDLKVLEIIKKKKVDIGYCCYLRAKYNASASLAYNHFRGDKYKLTQEEFDSIKEWLEKNAIKETSILIKPIPWKD